MSNAICTLLTYIPSPGSRPAQTTIIAKDTLETCWKKLCKAFNPDLDTEVTISWLRCGNFTAAPTLAQQHRLFVNTRNILFRANGHIRPPCHASTPIHRTFSRLPGSRCPRGLTAWCWRTWQTLHSASSYCDLSVTLLARLFRASPKVLITSLGLGFAWL